MPGHRAGAVTTLIALWQAPPAWLVVAVKLAPLLGIALILVYRRHAPPGWLGLSTPTRRDVGIGTFALGLFFVASAAVNHLTNNALHSPPPTPMPSLSVVLAGVVSTVLVAPFVEELVFRGLLLDGLRRTRLGNVGAVLVTSALWAPLHIQYGPIVLAFVFAGGIVLGWLRLASGSLWLTIGLHAVVNGVAQLEMWLPYLTGR